MPNRKPPSIERELEAEFPPIYDNADFMRVFGRLEEKLDGQARSMRRVEERLDDGLDVIGTHTGILEEQTKTLATIVKRQSELKTAITVDGAVNFTIKWGKVSAVVSALMGATACVVSWFWHLSIISAFVRVFKDHQT